MQCPNCRFENMPGVTACGRCNGSLGLATATIDVHPRRAGKWAKRLRKLSFRRQSFQVRDAIVATTQQIRGGGYFGSVPEGPLLMRLVVPGWAQIYCGRKLLGRTLLTGYIICLLIAVLFIGTQYGSMMLGLAFACHASSVIDIVNGSSGERSQRVSISLSFLVMLALVVYMPAGWLLSLVTVPRVINGNSPPFRAGDVVLYSPRNTGLFAVHPGQIVLYRLPDIRIAAEGHRQYRIAGERIDRILAGPGQHVVWREGQLEVDGNPSPLLPVDATQSPAHVDVIVPEAHFMILPSTLHVNLRLAKQDDLNHISLIRASDVVGKVYWQQQPLSRMGWIH